MTLKQPKSRWTLLLQTYSHSHQKKTCSVVAEDKLKSIIYDSDMAKLIKDSLKAVTDQISISLRVNIHQIQNFKKIWSHSRAL